ncbi:AMP-binding protein [Psychrobacillus soli]|uniref:AMP-binding protein n=1 Tax=Psychrobacillus soli TaxID=1543965 RepID=A0A544TJU4_9BACI|nr:AMP-binding protein [Psychrobacillus soli]TQR17735.1 AMP-binding protein [Psychrobacillus soli]
MNLVETLLHNATRHPNKIALTDGQESRTYSELVQSMKKVANGLYRNGFKHENIAILSSNRIEFVEVFLGTIYAGCVPIPLDPKWSTNELTTILQQCKPKKIFVEDALLSNLNLRDREMQMLTFSADETGSYANWIAHLKPEAKMDDTNELLFIGFTSGTTGIPKGYMRTHLSWIKSFAATNEAFQFDEMEHILAPGPFVQSLSLFALMQSLYSGATFHIVRKFSAKEVLRICSQHSNAILFVVPTMIEPILEQVTPGQVHIQALVSSGAKWSEASIKRAKEVFGEARLYEFYGSSEASYISYLDVNAKEKPNSLGKPFPGVQVSIRDEQFQEVPSGTIGQLCIRSDMMFLGYHHLPEETKAAFRDGWLLLGDYMSMDEEGYLYLAGRVKNMLVSGGLNIYPEEVESVLRTHSAIREVMVLGIPDAYWGERVTALIKWDGQQRLSIEEVKEYCRSYLASYKVPKQLITVDDFIYTSSGKLARQAMKDYMEKVMV